MKNERILQAVDLFREKIELAHNSNTRSQDILHAIRGLLEDINASISIGNNIPADAQQEIMQGIEQIINTNKK